MTFFWAVNLTARKALGMFEQVKQKGDKKMEKIGRIGRIVIKNGVGYWNGHKSRCSEASALACTAFLHSCQLDFKVTENDCTYYATYDTDTGKLVKW